MAQLKVQPRLNELLTRLRQAIAIHDTIHGLQLDFHLLFPTLSPEQKSAKIQIISYTLNELEKKRDNLLVSFIQQYPQFLEEKNAESNT